MASLGIHRPCLSLPINDPISPSASPAATSRPSALAISDFSGSISPSSLFSCPYSVPGSSPVVTVTRGRCSLSAEAHQQPSQGKNRSDDRRELSSSSSSTSASASASGRNRRDLFLMVGATAAAAVVGTRGLDSKQAAVAAEAEAPTQANSTPAAPAPPTKSPARENKKPDMIITDKVYLDLNLCPTASRSDRTLGNTSQLCTVGEPLGRIVIGLYGRLVPQTVKNFKAMINGKAGTSYAGTIFHRVFPGQYIQAGRQGSKDRGEVSGLLKLPNNQETVSSKSYVLPHNRPGTVSLALAENDDDQETKLDVDYRNVQFLITTGPGPAPQLDNGNIVFGTVMEGLDVVAAVAGVPTYRPNERIKQFNEFATFLGDERAANARNFWDKPLRSVVITGCGEVQMGFPVFPPGLP